MKTPALVITGFIFCHILLQGCSSAGQKQAEKDLKVEGFHGQVKSVRERHYMAGEENGKLKKRMLFDEVLLLYNEKGQVVEKHEYNEADGGLTFKFLFQYDDAGKRTEVRRFDHNGQYDRRYMFLHDDKGNEKEEWVYEADSTLRSRWTYGYDERGNKTEVNEHTLFGIKKRGYRYDDRGNVTEESVYALDGSVENVARYTYKYTFDKKKNWTRRVIYFNDGEPLEIIEREIEYVQ